MRIRVVFAETGYEKQRGVCERVRVDVWCHRSTLHHDTQRPHSDPRRPTHTHTDSGRGLQMPQLLSQSGSTCRWSYVCVVSRTMPLIHRRRCTLTLMGNSYVSLTPDGITHTRLYCITSVASIVRHAWAVWWTVQTFDMSSTSSLFNGP